MNLRWMRHMYVTPLLSTVYYQRKAFDEAGVIRLRGDEGDLEILARKDKDGKPIWRNATNMAARIRRAVEEDIVANKVPLVLGDTGRFWIGKFSPESCTPWERDETDRKYVRLILALETNPAVLVTCGGQTQHMPVGGLWWMQVKALHSFQNWGAFPAVHMNVEIAIEEGA